MQPAEAILAQRKERVRAAAIAVMRSETTLDLDRLKSLRDQLVGEISVLYWQLDSGIVDDGDYRDRPLHADPLMRGTPSAALLRPLQQLLDRQHPAIDAWVAALDALQTDSEVPMPAS